MKTDYPNDDYRPDDEYPEDERPEVEGGLSAVAQNPQSRMAIMVILVVVLGGFIYWSFFGGTDEEAEKAAQPGSKTIVPVKPPVSTSTGAIERAVPVTQETQPVSESAVLPALPEPPALSLPTPPAPPAPQQAALPLPPSPTLTPPPPPSPTSIIPEPLIAAIDGEKEPAVDPKELEKEKQLREARRRSGIVVVGGGEGGGAQAGTGAPGAEPGKEGEDEKGGLSKLIGKESAPEANFKLSQTSAPQAKATTIGRSMETVIAQGKVIDAVLETAINTDLDGMLRAVVSRDIYSEAGKNILIPKGSRLVGTYTSGVKRGQRRVYVMWSRVIRPDGIDVALESQGTDALGRAGVAGVVDDRYFEVFGNAVLLSVITAAVAIGAEQFTNSDGIQERTNNNGSSTTSGKPSDFAIAQSVQNMGGIANNLANEIMKTQPTIYVDQGTKVKVFVNRDLLFPTSVASNIKVVE